MYALIGVRCDDYYSTRFPIYERDIVALFDSEKDALQYIEDSKLKQVKDKLTPFKKKSLLGYYEEAEIEEYYEPSFPINPTIS